MVFVLSVYARRHILNENMRAKLGKKNNYLGAVFSVINGYVLIYFLILPMFSMNVIGAEAFFTNKVLENPPPFSRIARTAEKAVPIKSLADKANAFQELLSADGIEGYYNDAIYEYQQTYMGGRDSVESSFMNEIYPNLSSESQLLIQSTYEEFMNNNDEFTLPEALVFSNNSYRGISRVLVEEVNDGSLFYEDLIDKEAELDDYLDVLRDTVKEYEALELQYEYDLENYEYQLLLNAYNIRVDEFKLALQAHLDAKMTALLTGTEYTTVFTLTLPEFDEKVPAHYEKYDVTTAPSLATPSQDVTDAQAELLLYKDKDDVKADINDYGKRFLKHKGLLIFYVDKLKLELASSSDGGNIDDAINAFKVNYDVIIDNITDQELKDKLYLAKMSVTSYDVFNTWLTCTDDNSNNVLLEDIGNEENRCNEFDLEDNTMSYDFTDDALNLATTLFEGEKVSWFILQFKYDYESGAFTEEFNDYEEIVDILDGMKELADEYDSFYKDIANSIEGNISMVFKIGISVAKFHVDVYDTLENTPLISAVFNDLSRLCSNKGKSAINREVEVCLQSESTGGFIGEAFNMRYLSGEILFKAYVMVDGENERIIYDTQKMREYLDKVNDSVEKNVIAAEVIVMFGDQFAFNVIGENRYTLLEQMYDEGQITIEAMRVLADDEHGLFSEEFRYRVRSLIR